MPSEIAPCPVCGGEGEPAIMDGHARCLDRNGCSMLPLPIADWNRLSRAAALLRDVETIDACLQQNGSLALNVFADWTGITIECLTDGAYVDQRTRPTLDAALAALAGEVRP